MIIAASGARELAQQPMASNDAVEAVAAFAGDPLTHLLHTGRHLLARNRSEELGTQLALRYGVSRTRQGFRPEGIVKAAL